MALLKYLLPFFIVVLLNTAIFINGDDSEEKKTEDKLVPGNSAIPIVTVSPDKITLYTSYDALLYCNYYETTSSTPVEITWIHGNDDINTTLDSSHYNVGMSAQDGLYFGTKNAVNQYLLLINVSPSDAGEYKCRVTSDGVTTISQNKINVTVLDFNQESAEDYAIHQLTKFLKGDYQALSPSKYYRQAQETEIPEKNEKEYVNVPAVNQIPIQNLEFLNHQHNGEQSDKIEEDVDNYDIQPQDVDHAYVPRVEPEFTYRLDAKQYPTDGKTPFAVSPVDSRYYQQVPDTVDRLETKRAIKEIPSTEIDTKEGSLQYEYNNDLDTDESIQLQEMENSFEEPRQQRQNPNLAANKVNKVVDMPDQGLNNAGLLPRVYSIGKFNAERDIPTSLVPTSPRHQHVIQQALKNNPGMDQAMNVYIYAMVAGISAAALVAVGAFTFGWYTIHKKSKSAADVEYPAYGVTGPNTDVSPSGDRRLAHSAQMYHYQHQKQQIIAMENRGGVAERNGSVSDAESEDENEEGDYTVYECPGFATTGEMEVKNPLFLDEPTPASQNLAPAADQAPKK